MISNPPLRSGRINTCYADRSGQMRATFRIRRIEGVPAKAPPCGSRHSYHAAICGTGWYVWVPISFRRYRNSAPLRRVLYPSVTNQSERNRGKSAGNRVEQTPSFAALLYPKQQYLGKSCLFGSSGRIQTEPMHADGPRRWVLLCTPQTVGQTPWQ